MTWPFPDEYQWQSADYGSQKGRYPKIPMMLADRANPGARRNPRCKVDDQNPLQRQQTGKKKIGVPKDFLLLRGKVFLLSRTQRIVRDHGVREKSWSKRGHPKTGGSHCT